jgi:hypothetical protein
MGHSVEARVIADLRLVYKVDGEQRGFSDFGGRFRGHCDGIIRGVTSRPHVLEIKSANDASFKRFRELGIGARAEYAAQVQCYMGYAGLERALFVVENKNDQSLLVRRVRFDAEAFAALRDKAWGILEAKAPPAADRSDCRWCDHEGAACASVDAGSPACCTCAWFLPWEELRKAGALTGGDVCCLRRAPASWLGRCERYQQTA